MPLSLQQFAHIPGLFPQSETHLRWKDDTLSNAGGAVPPVCPCRRRVLPIEPAARDSGFHRCLGNERKVLATTLYVYSWVLRSCSCLYADRSQLCSDANHSCAAVAFRPRKPASLPNKDMAHSCPLYPNPCHCAGGGSAAYYFRHRELQLFQAFKKCWN